LFPTDVLTPASPQFLSIRSLPVPTVAALNGPAIGAGLGVALACDCRVAAADAKLGLTFVGLGLHPGMGSTHFLPRIAGPAAAAKLLLSGRIVSGTEALAASSSSSSTGSTIANISPDASSMAIVGGYGFVEEVTPSGAAAVDAAIATAKGFAAAAPVAVSTCLATLRAQGDDGLHASLQREAAAQAVCYASADYRAGVLAIMEKRKPVLVPIVTLFMHR
jgi:enoyl-CoA hydratase